MGRGALSTPASDPTGSANLPVKSYGAEVATTCIKNTEFMADWSGRSERSRRAQHEDSLCSPNGSEENKSRRLKPTWEKKDIIWRRFSSNATM
jgi:hypothetical protein